MVRSLSVLLGIVAIVAPGAVAAAGPQHVPLEQYRKGVAVRLTVAGRERLFQVDTAGGLSVISPALAKEIGCAPWGDVVGFHMTGARISAPRCDHVALARGPLRLEAPFAIVMDVGTTETPLDGVLALDVLAGRTVTFDFAGREMTIETPVSAAARVRGAIELPAHLAREVGGAALSVFVEAPTARGSLRLEVDSGNGGTILISKPLRALVGLRDTGDKPQNGTIHLAPGVDARGLIFSPDLVIDGNLGMPFLKNWIVTLDLAGGRVWVKPNPIPPPSTMGVPPPVPTG